MHNAPWLHMRLRSCLQAILDLEPELRGLRPAEPLLAEFSMLKDIYGRIETIAVREEDVRRIEDVTAHFLKELEGSVSHEALMHPEQRYLQ